jgi:hypothetical protein
MQTPDPIFHSFLFSFAFSSIDFPLVFHSFIVSVGFHHFTPSHHARFCFGFSLLSLLHPLFPSICTELRKQRFSCYVRDVVIVISHCFCRKCDGNADWSVAGLTRPPMYPFSTGQYPYPMLSPEMSQVAASW